MTPNELIKKGSNFLKNNNIKSHIIDAELLLSKVSGKSRENLLVKSDIELNHNQIKTYNNLIFRRGITKEPVAYILNKKEFWSIKLDVNKDVLIPRPETEMIFRKKL